jgi:hypothetical protein
MAPSSALASKNWLLRTARALCLALLGLAAAASCTSAKDTEDYVPSQPGAVQPAPTKNGNVEDEATACSALTKAESSARSMLGCEAAKRTCPDYIRPAGGAECFVYDQGSVVECAKDFSMFTDCADFDSHPCLVIAIAGSQCSTNTGEGGMGGVSGGSAEGGGGGMVDASNSAGAGGTP